MKSWIKWLLCMGLLACMVQAASAFTVKEVSVPKTDLKAGDNVRIDLEVSIAVFTASHDFQLASDLTGTACTIETYNSEINQYQALQVDKDRSGNWIILGWVLPSDSSFVLKVTFTGKVPDTTSSQNLTLLRISELSAGSTVSGGEYKIERRVINPQEMASQITSVRSDLQQLKTKITAEAGAGIDTSPASTKANEAETAVNKADSLRITSISQAQTQIDLARTAIKDGYTLLDKAAAQTEIVKVESTMSQVDSMVTYFTTNRSIEKTDSRLVAITNKYDLASQTLSSANDMVTSGNYLGGKAKAVEASRYADEAFNLSTSLKAELGEGGISVPGINPLFLVLGIGIIVIGVGGYFAYKKFFHWDELG